MDRAQKTEQVKDIRSRFDRMSSAVFLDFTGMTVEEVTKLRDTFRAKGVEYKVVKNTLVTKALADQKYVGALAGALKGMTGIAWSFEEPSMAARVLKDISKENEKQDQGGSPRRRGAFCQGGRGPTRHPAEQGRDAGAFPRDPQRPGSAFRHVAERARPRIRRRAGRQAAQGRRLKPPRVFTNTLLIFRPRGGLPGGPQRFIPIGISSGVHRYG